MKGNQVFFIIRLRVNKNKFDSEEQKKNRSVVDSYVASYTELCEFESQQGRFLHFFNINYSFTY